MLPFLITIEPGAPAYEQVLAAVHRALATGRLKPGEAFPSVRTLSREAGINPSTAHKVVQWLTAEGVLEIRPGIGASISPGAVTWAAPERLAQLQDSIDTLVVQARRLGGTQTELTTAIVDAWKRLSAQSVDRNPPTT